MKNPKLSIIIPCYGVERYLDRCMETIVRQTLKDIEIILVDDKSPDRVPQMCDEWANKDARIKVIHKEKNEGLGFARNTGLDAATGEYVAFVDSDDYVDPTMYEKLYAASEQGTVDVVYCGLRQETSKKQYVLINDFETIKVFGHEYSLKVAQSFIGRTDICRKNRFFMSVWHGIYKRDIIANRHLRFFSEREILSEDLPFQLEFCLNADKVKFIPDHLYTYCFNLGSLTRNFKVEKFRAAYKLRSLLLDITADYGGSRPLIDAEFYSRIRSLIRSMVFSENLSFCDKLRQLKLLCSSSVWNELDMTVVNGMKWKYKEQFQLLKANAPLRLMLFTVFDKLVNKNTLKFLNKKI